MNENLNEMIKETSNANVDIAVVVEAVKEDKQPDVKENDNSIRIAITNFYDWFLANEKNITSVERVDADVSKINAKDSIIFKVPKKNAKDENDKELISFYNPAERPVLNLPPIYVKIFKNDTFEALHQVNERIFIKSYGVKTGLILVYCQNVDGKIIPYEKVRLKKEVDQIILVNHEEDHIGNLDEPVNFEDVVLLYKQAAKEKDAMTTKLSTVDWFLNKRIDVVDINHLLKIDSVLITVI